MDSQFVADWSSSSSMGDAFAPLGFVSDHHRSRLDTGEDDGLVELLWCNGNVVLQNQAPRKSLPRPGKEAAATMQEGHEEAPWFEYRPVVDDGGETLEKDLFSEMFGEMEPADAGRVWKEEEEERSPATALGGGELMPPPPPPPRLGPGEKAGGGVSESGVVAVTDAGESSSVLTVGSRGVCGSNHVRPPSATGHRAVFSDTTAGDSAPPPPPGYATYSIPVGSSTMAASSSLRSRPPVPSAASRKRRKQRDSMDHQPTDQSLSEDVEYESAAATTTQKLTPVKRRRAADVHNLSERRRRDRINEKMKALQELIPHCNKTDKASMLDEAIEYLKSLQLQLQMMWMGGAAAAVPAPAAGVHQYMQRMTSMPRMHPSMPTAEESSPVSHLPAANTYARYLAVEHLRPPPPAMGMMSFYQLGAAKNPKPPSPVGNHTGAAS